MSKLVGVLVAVVFAWKKYSFIIVIMIAMTVTGMLRYIGFA
ncbi:putative membrane protein [Acinetobacter sp. 263903-1]|jgi:hypothetical protein|nr:putative membrane protein [Acinetobacter sp. 1461402]KCX38735.1 putative membrane protein [Acinetobacter sp. 263903-1]